jgi:hypothetical protein
VAHRTSIEDERERILAALRSAQEQLSAEASTISELRQTIGALQETARLRDDEQQTLLRQTSILKAERDALAVEVDRQAAGQAGRLRSALRRLRGSR